MSDDLHLSGYLSISTIQRSTTAETETPPLCPIMNNACTHGSTRAQERQRWMRERQEAKNQEQGAAESSKACVCLSVCVCMRDSESLSACYVDILGLNKY